MAIYRGTGATGTGGESDFAQLAQDAIDSAAAALVSENNAAASEAAAASSEANAAISETNAAASAAIVDIYLGPKTSDPTLNNTNGALISGNVYFNTTVSEMRVYTGSAWIAAYTSGSNLLLE